MCNFNICKMSIVNKYRYNFQNYYNFQIFKIKQKKNTLPIYKKMKKFQNEKKSKVWKN